MTNVSQNVGVGNTIHSVKPSESSHSNQSTPPITYVAQNTVSHYYFSADAVHVLLHTALVTLYDSRNLP